MTKTCRKPILVILLTLCLAALCGVIAACGNDTPTDTSIAYSVTVKTAEGDPAPGVSVKVKKGSASFGTQTTDANGKASFTLAKDSYTVELSKLPAGYELPDGALTLTADEPELTVTLDKAFAYTVKLVQPDGTTPFYAEGVKVGICLSSGQCLNPVALTASGVVSIEAPKDDYHVQLIDLPAGYAYDGYSYGRTVNNYYSGGELSATDTEITVPVYPVNNADISYENPEMSDEEKAEFATELQLSSTDDNNVRADFLKRTAHMFTTEAIKSGDIVYYMFTPSVSSKYKLYSQGKVYPLSESFASALPANPMAGAVGGQELTVQADKVYYFAVAGASESQAAPVKFVIADPSSSYIEYNGISGEIDVEIGSAGSNAVIEFTPTQAGAYKATTLGDALTVVTSNTLYADDTSYAGPDDFAKGSSSAEKLTSDMLETRKIYFMITATADEYPVTVKVKIEQLNTVANTTTDATVTETLTKYGDAAANKELVYVEFDDDIVYNETDKLYHLGDENGPVVLVNLTEDLLPERFEDGGMLAYIDMNTQMGAKYVLDVTSDDDKDDLTKGNTYKDYRLMLRGFKEYEFTQMGYPVIPETLETENCYINYVNADGVYPLTQELKEFLELFFTANLEAFLWQIPEDAEYGCEWKFPLCYYADKVEPDVIVGEYEFVFALVWGDEYHVDGKLACDWDDEGNAIDWVDITADYMTLVIGKRNTYTITDRDGAKLEKGRWTKNADGTYTFVFSGFMDTVTYTVTYDPAAKKLTFVDENGTTVYIFQQAD